MNIKRFGKRQNQMLDQLCESVICSSDLENWEQTAISCVNNIENLESLGVKPEILEISAQHQLDNYSAAILYHSNHVV